MEQAIEREELDAPVVLTYVSDVYRFLAFLLSCYALGVYAPMIHRQILHVNYHYFIIAGLLSIVLTVIGAYNSLFGSLAAFCFGVVGSRYLQYALSLQPELVFIAGFGAFLIFVTATMAARIFPSRKFMMFAGLTASVLELALLFLLVASRYDVVISLILMTCYVYYDTHNVFERAKLHAIHKHRQHYVVMDAFHLFLDITNIFMDLVYIINRSKRRPVAQNN